MLQGQMVDGIDTVKAKDVDMSGNPVYYPKTDGTEVYRKQLQADGRSRIFTYRLVNEGEQPESNNTNQVDIVSLINQLRDDVHAEIRDEFQPKRNNETKNSANDFSKVRKR